MKVDVFKFIILQVGNLKMVTDLKKKGEIKCNMETKETLNTIPRCLLDP